MSTTKTVSPTPAEIISAASSELFSIYSGVKLTIERQFAVIRERTVKVGESVAVMDIWDKVASDFATALADRKRNFRSLVFNEIYAESAREGVRPYAERAAKLLVDAGFDAEAHIDNIWNRDLGTVMYQVVIHVGLR